jgi:hypothetical protein
VNKPWEKAHHQWVNELEKQYIYDVDDVEEEPTTFQKNDAQLVDTVKAQKLDVTHGKQKI